jgi:hypothetical protein
VRRRLRLDVAEMTQVVHILRTALSKESKLVPAQLLFSLSGDGNRFSFRNGLSLVMIWDIKIHKISQPVALDLKYEIAKLKTSTRILGHINIYLDFSVFISRKNLLTSN